MTRLTLAAMTALAIAIPATAQAQRIAPTAVAVLDTQRVFSECTACRAANTQLQQQVQQAQQRAQQLQQPLESEARAIQQAVNALNGKQPDAALQQRAQQLQNRQNTANQELTGREQTLRSIQTHVAQQINVRLGPIINQVMQTRGAAVVLDRSAALAVSPTIDVTNEVLAQLNQQLPSVSVTPLPQQQQQPATGR